MKPFPVGLLLLPVGLLGSQFLFSKFNLLRWAARLDIYRYAFILGLVLALVVALLPLGARPFIYFQF